MVCPDCARYEADVRDALVEIENSQRLNNARAGTVSDEDMRTQRDHFRETEERLFRHMLGCDICRGELK